ncbi:hypothetical protein [Duganella sp. LjRoot269]|uniref:hypothetical protein n=1 Tax=Duganella sp. LjRoot269 TaxID=3342305 RepID=UPI003ECEF163
MQTHCFRKAFTIPQVGGKIRATTPQNNPKHSLQPRSADRHKLSESNPNSNHMSLEITLTHHAGLGQQKCLSFAQANHVLGTWSKKLPDHVGGDLVNFKILDTSKGMAYGGEYTLQSTERPHDLGTHLIEYFSWICGHTRPTNRTEGEYRQELSQFSTAMKGRAAFYLAIVRDLVHFETTSW